MFVPNVLDLFHMIINTKFTIFDFNSNVSFFEAITESVLQLIQSFLVLREYGISSDEGTKYTQYVTIVSSLLSIAVALWTVSLIHFM